jgi:hypothetical protein
MLYINNIWARLHPFLVKCLALKTIREKHKYDVCHNYWWVQVALPSPFSLELGSREKDAPFY